VGAAGEAIGVDEFDGLACGGEGVSAVDAGECGVVGGFDTEFYDNRTNRSNRSNRHYDRTKHFEDFLIDTVGAGADDEADDVGNGEGLAIEFFKLVDRFVRVGKSLKISEIRRGAAVASAMELDAFFNLLADAFFGAAVRWVECVVATEGAAAGADGTVAVGAAEACVDTDFLDAGAELLFHIGGVGIETTVIEPRVHSEIFLQR